MKRLIFISFVIFIFYSDNYSQTGTGTSADPYRGQVTNSVTWDASHPDYSLWQWDEWGNKVIYVCRNLTNYRTLTINSGVTVTLGAGFALIVQSAQGSNRSVITINSGGIFAIEPGGYARSSSGSFVNNGLIRLRSDEYGIPSLWIQSADGGIYSGTGTVEETIYLTGGITGGGGHRWHYISVPFDGVSTSIFTSNPNTLDLAQYVEILVHGDNSVGWIAYDGYQYSTEVTLPGYAFNQLNRNQGFNYYCSSNSLRTFSGTYNHGDVNISLTCGSGFPYLQGFNLIGNPFISVLDWDYISDTYGLPEEVDNAIYFTVDDDVASYVNKIATGGATEYGSIPPTQGFFVHVNTPTSGVTMTIPATAGAIDPYQFRYKKGSSQSPRKSSSSIPLVRINLESQKDTDDLVIHFNENATNVFDKKFDAYKFSKTGKSVSTFSKLNNVDYSINGIPFPEISIEIPIGVYVSSSGNYKFSSNELKNLDGYSVTLKDLYSNITVDLKNGEIMVFNTSAGTIEDRFILTVSNLSTGNPEIVLPDKKFSIYSKSGLINILSLSDEFNNLTSTITIYDLTGKIIIQQNNLEWTGKGELKQIQMNSMEKGLLIVEIKGGSMKYVEKVNLIR